MEWSPQQDAALLAVRNWLRSPDKQVFRLFGFAGTGKTTLAKHFAEGVDGSVSFAAFTGKAAHIMRRKGCIGAQTIHRLIYRPRESSAVRLKSLEQTYLELLQELRSELAPEDRHLAEQDPQLIKVKLDIDAERMNVSKPSFTLNYDADVQYSKLIVVDECSMVDNQMGEDLLWFGVPVLVLGDPAQLPPVMGHGFFTNIMSQESQPEVMLTEIHRQAQDNPIIRMATTIREGRSLDIGSYGSSRVIPKSELNAKMALEADQLLVGRNVTRKDWNARMRQLLGRGEGLLPVQGDKLVCLRNNHEKGLLNGSQWLTDEVLMADEARTTMQVSPIDDDGQPVSVEAHSMYFLGLDDPKNPMPWWDRKEAEEFDYGYTMTVHKAQGSQWDNVVLMDESWVFKQDRAKWLYTAITRAAETLTVVRG